MAEQNLAGATAGYHSTRELGTCWRTKRSRFSSTALSQPGENFWHDIAASDFFMTSNNREPSAS